MNEEPLLEGDFGGPPGAGGGPRFHLCLTRTELQILGGPPGGAGVLRLADVVGCHTLRAPSLPAAAFFAVYAYPPRCRGVPGGPRRRRRAPTFRVDAAPHYEGNRATAERWARAIRCLVRGLPLPPQAGKGEAWGGGGGGVVWGGPGLLEGRGTQAFRSHRNGKGGGSRFLEPPLKNGEKAPRCRGTPPQGWGGDPLGCSPPTPTPPQHPPGPVLAGGTSPARKPAPAGAGLAPPGRLGALGGGRGGGHTWTPGSPCGFWGGDPGV